MRWLMDNPVRPEPVEGRIVKPFFVYILRCADRSYYVGHTDELQRRIAEHHAGLAGYTARRRPVELAYRCEFETRIDALTRELQIKGWSRAKKEALINEDWTALQQLCKRRPSTGSGRTG